MLTITGEALFGSQALSERTFGFLASVVFGKQSGSRKPVGLSNSLLGACRSPGTLGLLPRFGPRYQVANAD